MELDLERLPRHVAIIMDGNGRWAMKKVRNRIFGHKKGAESVRSIVTCCGELGIRYLTLYVFSKENWNRPQKEVKALWELMEKYLESELHELMDKQVRLLHIGDDDGIPASVLEQLRIIEQKTAHFDRLVLSLALNYGGRQEITRAAKLLLADAMNGAWGASQLSTELFSRYLYGADLPDPDLVIRTGGEIRVSNFLLWQIAYAELYFTEVLWPDFGKADLIEALKEFQRRERRFGRTSEQVRERKGSSIEDEATTTDIALSGSSLR